MTDLHYEHHFDIRKDKLCPFLLRLAQNCYDSVCNWHENIEIITVTKGSGTIIYGNRELKFSEGDTIIVNSGTLHRLQSKNGINFYYLIIDETFCTENGIASDSRAFTAVFRSEQTNRLFNNVVRDFNEYRGDKGDGSYLRASKVRFSVLALLIDICENHSEPGAYRENAEKPSKEYVKKVTAYMADRYNEPMTLDSLAAMCSVTKYHLAREFKHYTGQTVLTYLNTLRCRNAEICLAEGMSVTETAYECGFESISYFSRTYKKIMGVPPSKAPKG